MAKSIYRPEYAVLREMVRSMRLRSNMTQSDVSQMLGRGQSYISDIERGSRRLDIIELRDLCQCLAQPLESFIGEFEQQLAAGTANPPKTRARKSRRKY